MTTISNMVILTGNLGADVEVRGSKGMSFVHFSVATSYSARKGGGRYEERVRWIRVTAFGALARSMARLGKGSLVQVLAHLRPRVTDWAGTRHHDHDVIADDVKFLVVKEPGGGAVSLPEAEANGGAADAAVM